MTSHLDVKNAGVFLFNQDHSRRKESLRREERLRRDSTWMGDRHNDLGYHLL